MSAKKTHNMAVIIGKYQKDGETKNRYENVGARWEKDDGGVFFTMKKTFNPAGCPTEDGKDIFLSMFEIKEDEEKQKPKKTQDENL